MFIIELNYKTSLEEIDVHMQAHIEYLDKNFASGNFLISGRKIPREGGIIIANASTKEEIETMIQQDPFYKYKLADIRIIKFANGKRAKDINELIK